MEPTFRIGTFNVNYVCNAGDKNSTMVADTILKCGDDVVCLQESNEKWEEFLCGNKALTSLYPHIRFHHATFGSYPNPWGGFAVFSKFAFEKFEVIPQTEEGWYPAGVATLRIPAANDNKDDSLVQVLNVHLRAPVEWSEKRYWWGGHANWVGGYFSKRVLAKRLDEIQTFARGLDSSLPAVVVGDFNERGSTSMCVKYLEQELNFANLPKTSKHGFCGGLHANNSWRLELCGLTLFSLDYDHVLFTKQSLKAVDGKAHVGGKSGSDHHLVSAEFSLVV